MAAGPPRLMAVGGGRAAGDERWAMATAATGDRPRRRERPGMGGPGRDSGGEWAGRGLGRCLPFINRSPDGCVPGHRPPSLTYDLGASGWAPHTPVSAVSRDGRARDERRGHRMWGEVEGAGLLWPQDLGTVVSV